MRCKRWRQWHWCKPFLELASCSLRDTKTNPRSCAMKVSKLLLAAVLVIAIGAPIAGFVGDIKLPRSSIPTGEPIAFFHGLGSGPTANQSGLASLDRADAWLNSPRLSASALRGKVVLVHFWTYTCINWQRTQSYRRAWADKYKDKGLVVIGVHTAEFRFEKNLDNVRREAKALRVDYPVAVDSEYAIWRAFNNNYWPAQYFIDAQGRVRHTHFGEGAYEQSEMVIQRLLMEAGATGIGDEVVSVDPKGLEVSADWGHPEVSRKLSGLCAGDEVCVARGRRGGQAAGLYRPRGLAPE